jgi:hypothetical protein
MKKLASFLLVFVTTLAAVFTSQTLEGAITPVNPAIGEPDLFAGLSSNPQGNVMDTLFGPGNYTRVDDTLDQLWSNMSGAAKIRALFGSESDLYYNSGSHPDLFVSAPGSGGYTDQSWVSLPSTSETFNWIIHNPIEGTFSSIQSQNSGNDQMVTFQITGNTGNPTNVIGNYVIAWEAVQNLGDKDYQDLVVEVSSVSPIPEPATLSLLALGAVVLLGGLRLRRRS